MAAYLAGKLQKKPDVSLKPEVVARLSSYSVDPNRVRLSDSRLEHQNTRFLSLLRLRTHHLGLLY